MDKAWRVDVEMSPSCPRCGSSNTKFCYYNNYSLTQPRYFCKGCRRYWTKGGSLRNVPVGGGCRKSRRGKSLRLSTTSVVHSKSLGYGGTPNESIRQAYSHKGTSSVESSRSSMAPDGSHIDLAVVYANFLNPVQDFKTGSEIPELPMELDHSPEFSSFSNKHMEHSFQLQEEHAMVGCLTNISGFSADASLSGNDHVMYYAELEQQCSSRGHQERVSKYGLAPLPGEEVVTQEILWPNFQTLENHTPQVTQFPVFGPETQDSNLLFNDWSAFDLPCDDTFSKT